MKGNVHMTNM